MGQFCHSERSDLCEEGRVLKSISWPERAKGQVNGERPGAFRLAMSKGQSRYEQGTAAFRWKQCVENQRDAEARESTMKQTPPKEASDVQPN
jgi:hypothetical protein